jgi:SAM-dependent methyltransferase
VLKFEWRKDDLRRRFYPPDFPGMYQRFQEVIREHVVAGARVLDAGCGSGRIFRYDLGPVAAQIVGVDITPQLRENPNIHRPLLGDVQALPFRDASFDVVLTSHVVEHLLRPGGWLLVLTPNRFHYVPLVAALLPHRLHVKFNRSRGVEERDIFPTVYRANTAGRLRRLLEGAGLSVERLERFETEPEYLAFHPLAYRLGVAYERLVNRFRLLASLRVNLIAVARKTGG